MPVWMPVFLSANRVMIAIPKIRSAMTKVRVNLVIWSATPTVPVRLLMKRCPVFVTLGLFQAEGHVLISMNATTQTAAVAQLR